MYMVWSTLNYVHSTNIYIPHTVSNYLCIDLHNMVTGHLNVQLVHVRHEKYNIYITNTRVRYRKI